MTILPEVAAGEGLARTVTRYGSGNRTFFSTNIRRKKVHSDRHKCSTGGRFLGRLCMPNPAAPDWPIPVISPKQQG